MVEAIEAEPLLSFSACMGPKDRKAFYAALYDRAKRFCSPAYPIECHPGSDDWQALEALDWPMVERRRAPVGTIAGKWIGHRAAGCGGYGRDHFTFSPDDLCILVSDLLDAIDTTGRMADLASAIATTLRIELV